MSAIFWTLASLGQNTRGQTLGKSLTTFWSALIGALQIQPGSFPKAFVTHLPRVFSDHCSILLELIRPHPAANEKPFRFHTMWIHHPEFPEVVKKAWESNLGLHSAIRNSIDRAK